MSVELGIREVQMITDAIKSVVNDAIKFGNPENFKMLDGSYMKNAEDWRTSIISNLIQGTPGNTYTTHTGVLFNHTNKIDSNIGKIRLETLIDYALENYKAFEETETLGDLTAPEFLWTGFEETSEAIYDIAMELSSDFGLEIPSVSDDGWDIKTILTETSEALMDSDIKVEDLSNSLELQIRVLDDIRANELYQMYATFPSTEGVRPFMIQLIELYDQVDMLDTEDVFTINETLEDLYINRDPETFLKEYNPVGKGRPTLEQVVKNKIQYYFQEMTDLQERYIKFNSSPSTIFQSVHNSDIERMFSNIGSIEEPMRDAFGDMIFSSKEPAQFSSSFKVFDGSDTDLPFQVNKTYMNRFQEIAGRKAYDVTLDPNYAVDLNKTTGMTAGEFLNDYVSKNIYDQRIDDDMREKLDRININDAKTDLPYDPRYVTPENLVQDINKDTPTNVVDDVKTVDIENYKPITIEILDDAGLHARPAEKLVASFNKQNIPLVILEDGNLKEIGMIGLLRQQKLKGETLDIYIPTDAEFNLDNVEGIKLAPTPTNVVDDLDDVISKTDGVENLNKAKQIMNKNPGVFKKIFSVLEKLDIGDQVITKAVLPALGRIGVAGATGPLALAYAGYETALLLGDISNAIYQARTTDEGFWDNFGEVSDKYSISYKISKPVYDIIFSKLTEELEQEDEGFIPQYTYGR